MAQGLRRMPEYERRLHQIPYPQLRNPDGSVSTHRMAAEVGEDGNWSAFPTIQQGKDGRLRQLELRDAQRRAMKAKNYKDFGKNKEAALEYAAGGYKKGTNIEPSLRRIPNVGQY